MRQKVLGLLLAFALCWSLSAEASVGVDFDNAHSAATPSTQVTNEVTDFNILGVTQRYFDGSVMTIDLTDLAATGGTLNGVTLGDTTPVYLQGYRRNVQVISATASTVGTVTIAKSGTVFAFAPKGDSSTYMVTLPGTASTTSGGFTGENYTFTTASGITLQVRVPWATDSTIAYGTAGQGAGVTARLTSPASSGSTVSVVGYANVWYITSMETGADQSNKWTASTTA